MVVMTEAVEKDLVVVGWEIFQHLENDLMLEVLVRPLTDEAVATFVVVVEKEDLKAGSGEVDLVVETEVDLAGAKAAVVAMVAVDMEVVIVGRRLFYRGASSYSSN